MSGVLLDAPETALPRAASRPEGRALSYGVVAGLLLAAYALISLFFVPGITDDYWDHAAAVRAMAEHLTHPTHPLFAGISGGDRWFNPYLWTLAAVSHLSGLAPLAVLKLGGFAGCLLLVWGVERFGSLYLPDRRAAAWLLLGYLFFWTTRGAMLREIASYPSVVVASGAFLYWYALVRYLRSGSSWWAASALAVGWVLWLSHQLQGAVALGNGLLLAWIEQPVRPGRRWIAAAIPFAAVGFGELWPFFSSVSLLFGRFGEFGHHESGPGMRAEVLFDLYWLGPVVAGIAWLAWQRASTPLSRWLKVSLISSLAAWLALFAVRSQYTSAALLNIGNMAAMALGLVAAGAWDGAVRPRLQRILRVVLAVMVALQVKYTLGWFRQFYATDAGHRHRAMLSAYPELARRIGADDVVLSDVWTSWHLPAFSGKVLTRPEGHQLDYRVPRSDIQRRAEDAETFFSPNTSEAVRRSVLARYHVRYLVINARFTPQRQAEAFAGLGHVVWASDPLILIAIDERRGAPG